MRNHGYVGHETTSRLVALEVQSGKVITERTIRRGSFRTFRELVQHIDGYLAHRKLNACTFH